MPAPTLAALTIRAQIVVAVTLLAPIARAAIAPQPQQLPPRLIQILQDAF